MMTAYVVALSCGLSACAFAEEEAFIGEAEYAVFSQKQLEHDLLLDCRDNETVADPATSFEIELTEGQTLLVGGDALIDYTHLAGLDSDELPITRLACQFGDTISAAPAASAQLSMTGQNVWQSQGQGNLSDAHGTRGIYTATQDGTHVCWLTYACLRVNEADFPEEADGKVTVRETSSIHHYSADEYPGANWKLPSNVSLTTDSATTIQDRTWAAGIATLGDGEVVARWSPHVSTCLGTDEFCDGLLSGWLELGFDWRFVVWQYYGNSLCNIAIGAWSHVACSDRDHHCGVKVLSSVFPIVLGAGTDGTCGTALSSKKFRVFAQMKKPSDVYVNDLVVHGGTYTNLVIYSRP